MPRDRDRSQQKLVRLFQRVSLEPGWSANGHRIKAVLDYSRGPEKTWIYGALRVRNGKELTRCAASRNSTNYIALLEQIESDNPEGEILVVTLWHGSNELDSS